MVDTPDSHGGHPWFPWCPPPGFHTGPPWFCGSKKVAKNRLAFFEDKHSNPSSWKAGTEVARCDHFSWLSAVPRDTNTHKISYFRHQISMRRLPIPNVPKRLHIATHAIATSAQGLPHQHGCIATRPPRSKNSYVGSARKQESYDSDKGRSSAPHII